MSDTPVFSKAAVAAPHYLAAQSGEAILEEGGNAIEAMVAMAATIAVVYPHMNSIGGDGFWLIREPKGATHAIEACGFAGSEATIAHYHRLGHDRIPLRGPLAALTVPGAIGGWERALEGSRTLSDGAVGGKLPLSVLMHHAIALARDGYEVSHSESRTIPNEMNALRALPDFAKKYLVDGERPKAGMRASAPATAVTLEQLGRAGLSDFYRGDVAREMAAEMEAAGSPVTRDDLKRYTARLRAPLSVKLKDATVYNCPPPTQGLASLALLGIFEHLGVRRADSIEHLHGLIEATKIALMIRDRVVTDFDWLDETPGDFLTEAYLGRQASRIAAGKALPFPLESDGGDTVWMGAIDASGLAVSYIQSTYWEYGSGIYLPKTGVLMQNRGASFSLDDRARNPLQPGRRPFHTLNPPLAAFDDGRIACFGSMGGDGQPQFQAQVFSRYRLGVGIADAIAAPRYLLGRTWGSHSTGLKLEEGFDPDIVRALEKAGQPVEMVEDDNPDQFGHAGMLLRHAAGSKKGRIEAAHDPRSDGDSAGF